MAKKPTAHDAQLILKLYDLRREAEMRRARNWFTAEFWPQTAEEFLKVVNSFPSRKTLGFAKWEAIGIWRRLSY